MWVCLFNLLTSMASVGLAAPLPSPVPTINSLLRFRVSDPPVTLDWNLAHTSYETPFLANIMEGLAEHDENLIPQPRLAESWTVSEDGLTYRFAIRKGVVWSDGVPLVAQQFVDSWDRLKDPKLKSAYANYLEDVQSAKAEGPQMLVVKLKRAVPYFLHLPTFWATFPVRKDLISKDPNWADPMKLVTLGPYLATQRTSPQFFRMVKNPKYWDTNPGPDAVDIFFEPSEERVRSLFAVGGLDLLLEATTADLLKAQEAGRRIEQYPYAGTFYLGFNTARGPAKDVRMRKALALGVDRSLIPVALRGGQQVADSFLPPQIPGRAAQNALQGSFDDAKRFLKEAGHRPDQSIQFIFENTDLARAVAEVVARQWEERLGVQVGRLAMQKENYRGALKKKAFDVFLGHWGADFPDASNFLGVFVGGGASNSTGWNNGRYNDLIRKARGNLPLAERMKLYYEAETLLTQVDTVILPLFFKKTAVILNSTVEKMEITALNYFFFKRAKVK